MPGARRSAVAGCCSRACPSPSWPRSRPACCWATTPSRSPTSSGSSAASRSRAPPSSSWSPSSRGPCWPCWSVVAFGIGGAIFQTTLRNPLASPDIVGVSLGASAAAVTVITLGRVERLVGLGRRDRRCAGGRAHRPAGRRRPLRLPARARRDRPGRGHAVGHPVRLHPRRRVRRPAGAAVADRQRQRRRVVRPSGCWRSRWRCCCRPPRWAARSLPATELGEDAAAGLGVGRARTDLLMLLGVLLVAVGVAAAGPVAFVAFLSGPIARALNQGRTTLLAAGLVGAADRARRRLRRGLRLRRPQPARGRRHRRLRRTVPALAARPRPHRKEGGMTATTITRHDPPVGQRADAGLHRHRRRPRARPRDPRRQGHGHRRRQRVREVHAAAGTRPAAQAAIGRRAARRRGRSTGCRPSRSPGRSACCRRTRSPPRASPSSTWSAAVGTRTTAPSDAGRAPTRKPSPRR